MWGVWDLGKFLVKLRPSPLLHLEPQGPRKALRPHRPLTLLLPLTWGPKADVIPVGHCP